MKRGKADSLIKQLFFVKEVFKKTLCLYMRISINISFVISHNYFVIVRKDSTLRFFKTRCGNAPDLGLNRTYKGNTAWLFCAVICTDVLRKYFSYWLIKSIWKHYVFCIFYKLNEQKKPCNLYDYRVFRWWR